METEKNTQAIIKDEMKNKLVILVSSLDQALSCKIRHIFRISQIKKLECDLLMSSPWDSNFAALFAASPIALSSFKLCFKYCFRMIRV